MNEILEKNLNCIKVVNPSLVQKIVSVQNLPEGLVLVQNPNKEYNLQYNNEPIHSIDGAQLEAEKIISNLPKEKNSLCVVLGLGLGYLFETLCEKTSGKVILYEDNIELLRAVFELVDFSRVLKRNDVVIVSNVIEFKDAYYNFYSPKMQISLTCLDYYKNHFPNKIKQIVEELNNLQNIADGTFSFRLKNNSRLIKSMVECLDKKIKYPCVNAIKDKFKNLPAIIVSAGASLYENLELLKKYQDKAVIFCVGNAYKTLREYGIKPQFVCIIEERYIEYQVDGIKTDDVNLIGMPTTFSKLFDYNFKNIFMYPSKENVVNSWYRELIEEKDNNFEGRGTVSYTTLYSAYIAGCNPIVLVGQDLAYVNDCCYSPNSIYSSLKCHKNYDGKWEVYCEDFEELTDKLMAKGTYSRDIILNGIKNKIKIMTDQLVIAKDQQGKDIRTELSFTYFAQYFSDFAQKYGENIVLINSSQGGLNIDGFKNILFDEVCEKYLTKNIDFENIFNNIEKNIKIDFSKIENNLDKEINSLKAIIQEIENNSDNLKAIEKQIQKYNKALVTTNSALQKTLNLYDKITSELYSKIHFYLMYKEQIELDDALKSPELTLPVIVKLCKLLYDYFMQSVNEVTYVLQKLEQVKEKFNESSCTTC